MIEIAKLKSPQKHWHRDRVVETLRREDLNEKDELPSATLLKLYSLTIALTFANTWVTIISGAFSAN